MQYFYALFSALTCFLLNMEISKNICTKVFQNLHDSDYVIG